MICYLSPDQRSPSGGVRAIYRHVDILNCAGFSAAVVHQQRDFRAEWFAHRTRVLHVPLDLRREDVLVVPETALLNLGQMPAVCRKVLLVQNAYYALRDCDPTRPEMLPDLATQNVIGMITTSQDSHEYLSHAFAGWRIHRVRYGIDPSLFYPGPKKRQICYMPRKHPEDANQVLAILRLRKAMVDFRIVPIHERSEAEAAAILRESQIFLSFGYPEGFGLPPAEAMACGCITIGYHGMGGHEYFKPEYGFPIEIGDILGYARTVEQVIRTLTTNPHVFDEMTARAGEVIRSTYSLENERTDVISCWRQILDAI